MREAPKTAQRPSNPRVELSGPGQSKMAPQATEIAQNRLENGARVRPVEGTPPSRHPIRHAFASSP
jgi:hypothetical protein